MSNHWIVSAYKFAHHYTREAAEGERDRLAEKTGKQFRVYRIKGTLTSSNPKARIVELEAERARLAADCVALRAMMEKHYPRFAGHALRLIDEGETGAGNRWAEVCKDIRQTLDAKHPGDALRALVSAAREANENPEGDYYLGLRCGVEDRDITDRYEAAEFGWDRAFEYINSILDSPLKALDGKEPGDA